LIKSSVMKILILPRPIFILKVDIVPNLNIEYHLVIYKKITMFLPWIYWSNNSLTRINLYFKFSTWILNMWISQIRNHHLLEFFQYLTLPYFKNIHSNLCHSKMYYNNSNMILKMGYNFIKLYSLIKILPS